MKYKSSRSGVPVGYRENWAYRGRWSEKKVKPGNWRFVFRATKGRRAKGYGSFGRGTVGRWLIRGIQTVRKIGKGRYQTKLVGTKRNLGFKVKRPRMRR